MRQLGSQQGNTVSAVATPNPQERARITQPKNPLPRLWRPERTKLFPQQPGGYQPSRRGIEIPEAVDLVAHPVDISASDPCLHGGR